MPHRHEVAHPVAAGASASMTPKGSGAAHDFGDLPSREEPLLAPRAWHISSRSAAAAARGRRARGLVHGSGEPPAAHRLCLRNARGAQAAYPFWLEAVRAHFVSIGHFVSAACTTSLTGRLMKWRSTADVAELALIRAEAPHGYRDPRALCRQRIGRPPRRWEKVLAAGLTRERWTSPYMSWPRQLADAIARRWRVV